MGSCIDECVAAVPTGARDRYRRWIRLDSAGYQDQALAAAERHHADFSVTARQYAPVAAVVHALAADPATVWTPALGRETEQGNEIAATTTTPARTHRSADRAPSVQGRRRSVGHRRLRALAAARHHHRRRPGADECRRGRGAPPAARRHPARTPFGLSLIHISEPTRPY